MKKMYILPIIYMYIYYRGDMAKKALEILIENNILTKS